MADVLRSAGNNFEEDSLRMIILEKILGGRDDDIHSVLAALDIVPEDKIAELQGLLVELKDNEEEFIKCFANMSAVEKYNLERAAFYNKSENESYCKSQWMMADKDGIHNTSRGVLTWVKNIWNVIRFIIGIFVHISMIVGAVLPSIDGKDPKENVTLFAFLFYLPIIIAQFRGLKSFISVSQTILQLINIIVHILKFKGMSLYIFYIFFALYIVCRIFNAFPCVKYVFNKKINKNLAFLLNKKFKYIKNYIETLKKIHALIKGDEALTSVFKKELASLEKVFGNEAGEETKDMLTKIDNQKLYDSFDDVNDTGEAMFIFDKNKDIFSDCIVDVNKINACVALKMNTPAKGLKKIEGKRNEKAACKEEKNLSSKDVKDVNFEGKDVEGDKKKKDKSTEKKDVREDFITQKQEGNEKQDCFDEKVRSEYKRNKNRANKNGKRKSSSCKRHVRTNNDNNKNKKVQRDHKRKRHR